MRTRASTKQSNLFMRVLGCSLPFGRPLVVVCSPTESSAFDLIYNKKRREFVRSRRFFVIRYSVGLPYFHAIKTLDRS